MTLLPVDSHLAQLERGACIRSSKWSWNRPHRGTVMNEKRSRYREKTPLVGAHIMKVETVAFYMMCYESAKMIGRWPSSAKKFRHGGVRMWFASGRFFLCAFWCAGNKELTTQEISGNICANTH